ncbi:MAG: NUDIX domain-containing protein [Bacteroidetes bacterium]|nr:NUDIX domain-containing protein [Bacteroidota bacterium]
MPNLYKINIDDKRFFLSDSPAEFNVFTMKANKALVVKYKSNKQLVKVVNKANQHAIKSIVIYHHNFDELRLNFFSQFIKITAAGGLVVNSKGELLFIFRQGKWDLPKGKLDPNESIEKAAVREVEEETGIMIDKIEKPLIITYHTYKNQHGTVLKENHWFVMSVKDDTNLKPQIEEGITHVEWIAIDNLAKVYDNSFNSIKDVIAKYIKKLKPTGEATSPK